jgi:hypothetical protein
MLMFLLLIYGHLIVRRWECLNEYIQITKFVVIYLMNRFRKNKESLYLDRYQFDIFNPLLRDKLWFT